MSEKKQTALDLLLDKITDYEMGETLLRLIGKDEIDHIRKVEREQIEKAFEQGDKSGESAITIGKLPSEYYKETYGE